jgi:hypothetical protein
MLSRLCGFLILLLSIVSPALADNLSVNPGSRGITHTSPAPWIVLGNQSGPVRNEGAAIYANTSVVTAQSMYNQAIMSGNATLFQSYDAVRGVAVAPANSTVNLVNAVAGYVTTNSVPVAQRTEASAFWGVAVCAADNSHCWAVSTVTSDNPSVGNTGATSGGTGKILTGAEFDLNITSPNIALGTLVNIGGTALPTNVTLPVNGIGISKFIGAGGVGTGTALYQNAIAIADACCATAIVIGASALSGASQPGIPIGLNYRAGNNTLQSLSLTSHPGGSGTEGALWIGGTGTVEGLLILAGGVSLASNFGITQNLHSLITADGTTVAHVCNDSAWATCSISISGAKVSILGDLQTMQLMSNATSGSNVGSNSLNFHYFNSSGASHIVGMGVDTGGRLAISNDDTGSTYFSVVINGSLATGDGQSPSTLSYQAGATAASGTNIGSYSINFHYFNSSSVSSLYAISATTAGQLFFNSSGAGSYVFNGPVNFTGTTSGNNAPAGDNGEYASAITLVASEVDVSTAAANVVTLSLTAGDWDVSGEFWVDTANGTATISGNTRCAITQTSGTIATTPADSTASVGGFFSPLATTSAVMFKLPVGPTRISLTTTTNIFLVGQTGVSAGTAKGYGILRARRVR